MSGATQAFGREWSAGLRRGTDEELRGWVETALGWCDASDAIALEHFRRDLELRQKPDRTYVTAADTAIERLLRERIADAYPGHAVTGEEYGVDAPGASVRWYLDPIDGTHNYMRGVPLFGTLIAVERDSELQAAVISAPALGQRWHAWRGGGAWAAATGHPEASRRLAVSGIATLRDSQLLYASARDIEASGLAPGFGSLLDEVWRDRGFGDFWGYTLVAEGAAEIMVELGLSPWDAAAPLVLVEEAGGRATDYQGRRSIISGTFLASNGRLHDEVLGILSRRITE
jgi:histidinol-phosphatase